MHGTTTAGHIQFGFTPFNVPSGSTSISIQVLYYDFKSAAQANTIAAELRIGSTPTHHTATTHSPGQGNAAIAQRTDNFATNPKTAAAWTVNDVNGVGTNGLVGFGWVSTDANPTITLSSILLQVTFTPPPTQLRSPLPSGTVPSLSQGYASRASQSDAPQQWEGLVAAYAPFLGVQGGTLYDLSGNGFHGTLTNMDPATDWLPGRVGLALDFDGTNDWVNIPTLQSTGGKASISMWLKTTQITILRILDDNLSGSPWLLVELRSPMGTIRWRITSGTSDNATVDGTTAVSNGIWHHIVGTYNGAGTVTLFQDGIQVSSTTNAVVLPYNFSRSMGMGANRMGTANFFAGQLDDVRLYSRQLTAHDVLAIYRDPYALYRRRRRPVSRMVTAAGPAPTITDVETDEQFTDFDTGVTITGTNFGATQGTGTVELASSSTYASATKVAQTVTSWAATSIDFTAGLGGLTPGTLYLFVTTNAGQRNTAFAVTVDAPAAPAGPSRGSLMMTGAGR